MSKREQELDSEHQANLEYLFPADGKPRPYRLDVYERFHTGQETETTMDDETPKQDGAPEINKEAFMAVAKSIFSDREFDQNTPKNGFWAHAAHAAQAAGGADKETVRRYMGVYPGELIVLCAPRWPLDWYTLAGTLTDRADEKDLASRTNAERFAAPLREEAAAILRWLGGQERIPGVPPEYLLCATGPELRAAEERRRRWLAAVTPRPTWTDMIRRLAQSDRRYANCDRSFILRGAARRREYRRWFHSEPPLDVPFLPWAPALARLAKADALEPGPPHDGRIESKLHRDCYLRHYMRGVGRGERPAVTA